ncbi:hypothetical protein [Paenibacillus sp. BC26]|uniref:hypothetical protein n=1 Tax=Paenibacillus sp. BC26 TaxID=1881032 RepID=UPI00210F0C18|nr:hypothetical protein [Paenibacillus sp. BC26]
MQLVKLFTVPGSRIRIIDLQLNMSQFVTLCRHSLALIRNSRSTIDVGIMVQDLTTGKENYSKGYSICEVIRLYEGFPSNFIQVLTKFFNSLKRTTRHKFDFEKLFANPLYDPIKLVYLDFAAAQQKKRINIGPSFLNRDLYPYISKTVACDILGVQYKVIVDLIKLRILKEVEINYQTLLIRDEVTKLLKLCKGEIMPLNDRVSIREVMPAFARKGITVAWLIFLIINGLLIPGSSERCISIMNVTFDKEVLQICLEQFEIINGLRKGTASMPNGKTDVQFGLATVTGKGVVFNDRVYSNTQMIKNQWFELALRTGSWTIPILYNPDEGEHLVLFDTAGLEVASSIEEGPEIEPAILESYYQALNSLKDQMKLFKQ